MITKQRTTILAGALGLYLAGMGFLGMGVLSQHDAAVRSFRAYLLPPTHAGSEPRDAMWAVPLSRVDRALVEQDAGAAERAWQDAYVAAPGDREVASLCIP